MSTIGSMAVSFGAASSSPPTQAAARDAARFRKLRRSVRRMAVSLGWTDGDGGILFRRRGRPTFFGRNGRHSRLPRHPAAVIMPKEGVGVRRSFPYSLHFMSDFPPLHDADALKRLLAGLCHPPAAVAEKAHGVYAELLRQSPRVRARQLHAAGGAGPRPALRPIRRALFHGRPAPAPRRRGQPAVLPHLDRLTRTAGTTTRFQARRGRSSPPAPPRYEIAISSPLMFQTFHDVQRPVRVNGLLCRDRVEALQRVFEHELIHLLEMLIWVRIELLGGAVQGTGLELLRPHCHPTRPHHPARTGVEPLRAARR